MVDRVSYASGGVGTIHQRAIEVHLGDLLVGSDLTGIMLVLEIYNV